MKNVVPIFVSVALSMLMSLPVSAQNTFRKMGGCLVMDVYKRDSNNKLLDKYCVKRKKSLTKRQRQWMNRLDLALLGQEVAMAYQIAERGISGTAYGVAKGRNVRIVIDPNEYVTAGVSATNDTVYIMLNAGLIGMIHDTVLAVGYEIAQLSGMPITETGITFSEWMELMRLASHSDDPFVSSPGPDNLNANWYTAGLIPRAVLLEFVFAHELAHLHHGSYCGLKKPTTMVQRRKVEEACDAHAIKSFNKNEQGAFNLAQYLPAFQLAHASYLSVFSEAYVAQAPVALSVHAETLLVEELNNAIPKRLDKNMQLMMSKLTVLPNEAKPFLKDLYKGVRRNPLPSLPSEAKHESGNYIKILPTNIDFDEPHCGGIRAEYSFFNIHKTQSVKAVVEIQSRVIPRDGQNILSDKAPRNLRNKKYRMIDHAREEITVKPNSKLVVIKDLPCAASGFAYPSVDARVVKSSWANI